jgi:hypothetical protein
VPTGRIPDHGDGQHRLAAKFRQDELRLRAYRAIEKALGASGPDEKVRIAGDVLVLPSEPVGRINRANGGGRWQLSVLPQGK